MNKLRFLAWLLAYEKPTIKARKMKKKLKISTLIIGVIVAVLTLSNSSSFAEKYEKNEVIKFELSESEIINVIEQVLEKNEVKLVDDKIIKIYNIRSQLVYESRDREDRRLKILLRRSDLILHTNSSSYYLLGDKK